MKEIDSCPYCGSNSLRIMGRQYRFGGKNHLGHKKIQWQVYVRCNKCHSRGTPIKTDFIVDTGYIGTFYGTEYWLGEERGIECANKAFSLYVEKAIEAWNRRVSNERT